MDLIRLPFYNAVMSEQIDAIYEHGILRPLTPLNLPESAEVTLILQTNNGQQDGSSNDPILGLLADDADLLDEIVEEAMTARESHPLRVDR
jgi:predicted DNA-binding antitoxin AbrB/MazE fold protein